MDAWRALGRKFPAAVSGEGLEVGLYLETAWPFLHEYPHDCPTVRCLDDICQRRLKSGSSTLCVKFARHVSRDSTPEYEAVGSQRGHTFGPSGT